VLRKKAGTVSKVYLKHDPSNVSKTVKNGSGDYKNPRLKPGENKRLSTALLRL
jgi:hypothetical protein